MNACIGGLSRALVGLFVVVLALVSAARGANTAIGTNSPGANYSWNVDDRNRSITYSGAGWTTSDPGVGWNRGTAKSSTAANDFFEYTNASCTRLKWFSTKSNDRGQADVYIDGELKATVDAYSATNQPTSAVFDSGELPLGGHAIKVVVLRQKNVAASDYWVECDMIEAATPQVQPVQPVATALPSPTPLPGAVFKNDSDGSVLCFGNWERETDQDGFHARDYRTSNVQYNTCEFRFRGSAVRWFGSKNRDHGFADVYLDGVLQQTVDAYNPAWIGNVVLFEKTGLSAGPLHTLRIVVRKERNADATDCYQTIDGFEAVEPVNYVEDITKAMRAEYAQIGSSAKPYTAPDTWKPVAYAARSPETGVSLQAGVFHEVFQKNIDYLNHCFASKTYCDGPGWFEWLPASNEGRLLQGAANALRWGERADMRNIVDTVVGRIQARQRADGYHNYYPEKDSFAMESGGHSERKNFDRVFWTRGLLDAGRAGNTNAYAIVRKFYDWFNASPYLPRMIHSNNSPNGFPGGPLVHLSPVGNSNDLIVSERYLDQEWWLKELQNGEPLCFTFYPGERPHCYDLLGLEAYVDQYRATGSQKYRDAVQGGWAMYRENFKHVGGTTAICENRGPYAPKSYKLTSGCTGETCGSVFWANINSRLMQLYPSEEKYAAEIEEAIYNTALACQDTNGYIRYHNPLHGSKDVAQCQGTCCESAAAGMLSKLPEYIYSIDKDGLWVNLYAASTIVWSQSGSSMTVTQATSFPNAAAVSMTVSSAKPTTMSIRIRVPSWATSKMEIKVNGKRAVTGSPGSYASIRRKWANNDVISFTLPMGFTMVKYTGMDQAADNVDRYALLRGPILMALNDDNGRIRADAPTLPSLLTAVEGSPLHYEVKGTPYRFVPYWQVAGNFTCFPMIEAALPQAISAMRAENLRCEYRVNPVGLDVSQPRLSWTLASGQRGEKQTAFQILAASAPETLAKDEGDLWSSGKVVSDQTIHIAYAGKPLQSRMRVWWKVRSWDKDSQPSAWSAPAAWTMGLLQPADWQAKWIADPDSATNVATRGPLNGYHSEIAATADTTKWVGLDLGRPQSFDAVRLFPTRPYDFQPDTPGFLFPVRFKIEAASRADFSDVRVIFDRTAGDERNPGTNAPLHRFASTTARFVRITVTRLGRRDGNNFAFTLAEMQVLKGENDLAKGAKVLALDSIETGPWAKANLTDGVVTTVKPVGGGGGGALPATMVRKSFQLDRPIKRATAYASALGLYELRLNGQRVGEQLLAPEWTSYRKRVHYQVNDVTALLHQGENAIAAFLGEGWFAGRLLFMGRFAYGTHPSFLLQLEVEFADGQTQTIISDGSWHCTSDGPIRSAGIYDGEVYDARKELTGWDAPGFDASSWRPALAAELDARKLIWQRNEPIQVVKELTPVKMTEPKPGVFVFDFGQNMVGWGRVKAIGATGKTITVRHAEMLNDDGTLYTANLRGAQQVDRYTPHADGEFTFEPHFTYHGFRFIELTGLAQTPSPKAVLGRVFHSSSPIAGRFECSDPSLNQLMQNILWTQRANLMSSPNDCPQRDERFGWMGDIQAFAQTAAFNMDMAAFFTKFVQDIRDDQADDGRYPDFAPHPGNPNEGFSGVPVWGDAGTIVPWRAYQNYADTRLLEEHFESARRWVDYIHKANPDLTWAKGRNRDYNDWLNGDWVKQKDWPNTGGSVPNVVFATAFFAHSSELVAKMAEVLGRKEEARRYGELFNQIKVVFNQRFVKPDGRIEGDTQGGYALALSFNLLPEDLRPKAARLLVENIRRYQNHLSTGIQTTHHAMQELTRNGQTAVGWQLLTNRTFPSWLYMIDNGATTIWERWDGYVKGRGFQDASMNSFNHWAFGAVGEWMWRNIAGLNPDDAQPGWKHFVIAPKPGGGVTWAKGEYQSIRGSIACDWIIEGATLTLRVVVPPNTTATIHLPTSDAAKITEGGKRITPDRTTADSAQIEVGSGRYVFVAPIGM